MNWLYFSGPILRDKALCLEGAVHAQDEKATEAMTAGTYGYWPAGMQHFVWTKGETIAQFHGMGPWSIVYVNPADDPRHKKD